jgi:uncharacterized membrane protein
MGSQPASSAPPIFEAVIVPHRSLSPAALRRLMVALAAIGGLTSIGFWRLGAWPVVGFSGIEITLAILLIRLNAQAVRSSEWLLLTEAGLRVVRTDRHGRRAERVLEAGWLNVVLEERPGRCRLKRRRIGLYSTMLISGAAGFFIPTT